MAWSSAVPGAVDALVAALQGAPGLAEFTVRDGPSTSREQPQRVLYVGWSGGEGSDVESDVALEGLGAVPDREQFTVQCALAVVDGGGDIAAARAAAYGALAAVGAAVAADRTLGGAVMRANIGAHTLAQDQNSAGAQATIVAGIACDAFTGR